MKQDHESTRCAASMPRPYTACVHIPLSVPSIQPSTDRAALRRVLMILRLRMAGQVPGRLRRDEAPQEAVDFPRLVAADGVHSARAAAAPWRPPCGRQPLPQAARHRSKPEPDLLAGLGDFPAHGSPLGAAGVRDRTCAGTAAREVAPVRNGRLTMPASGMLGRPSRFAGGEHASAGLGA